jgi:gamma-glutamyltranspeptidase
MRRVIRVNAPTTPASAISVRRHPPRRFHRVRAWWAAIAAAAVAVWGAGAAARALAPQPGPGAAAGEPLGARDPAWSPDGRRLALSVYDRLFVVSPQGKGGGPLVEAPAPVMAEREPAWSPDGSRIAFAADYGGGFDIYVVSAAGGRPERVTSLPGDERSPSWTRDDRIVFASASGGQWDLLIADVGERVAGVPPEPVALTRTPHDERDPAVSPDGLRVAFASTRDNDDLDLDLWVMDLPARGSAPPPGPGAPRARRVLRAPGADRRPAWAPDGDRIAFSAVREGVGGVWVAAVPPRDEPGARDVRDRPEAPPVLVSRRHGRPAWSPDGRTLAVADLPPDEPAYNGNPLRDAAEAPPAFAGPPGSVPPAFGLRLLPAPRPPDDGERRVATEVRGDAGRAARLFDRVWSTLERLYYRSDPGASAWRALRDRYRPRALAARDEASLEAVLDEMIQAQPLIKPAVTSRGAIVVSGHRLASEAGARILEAGGNVVDAAIAVSFALGVVEPEASGVGGDGMALVYLAGMAAPVAVDYKDQTPIRATLDNPAIVRGGRLVADGPAAANVPGVVAGLDLLYRRFGSGRVAWADLVAPAVALAEQGFVLDEALPTSIAEGRGFFEKYPEAARIFLPGGAVPRPGDVFVNRDYGRTLRAIASEGARAFYEGSIARAIAEDLRQNGGIIGLDDLAQYRALERAPVAGRFRGHTIYAPPPPVASGVSLVETLQILDRYEPRPGARPAADADYFHYLIEAWKARDPARRIADPALWDVDIATHLDPAHAASRFERIHPARTLRFEADEREPDGEAEGGRAPERIGRGTTAFVVADASGNMIAATQTLSTWGGTFYVSRGLGFLYNNHLRGYRTTRGAYGQLLPLMRSSSTSNPTLVFRGGAGGPRPWLALGAAGNAWITASVYGIVTGVVDGGLPIQAAVEAPRFLVTRDPADRRGTGALVQIEDRFPRWVLDDLARRGHRFQKIGRKGEVRYGYAAAALVNLDAGRVEGGAEPRRSHAAVAWEPAAQPR